MKKVLIFIASLIICLQSYAEIRFNFTELPAVAIRNPVQNKDLKEFIVVDFWASWCGPCKDSFPFYHEIFTKHQNKISWIAISEDSSVEDAKLFLKGRTENFHYYWDENNRYLDKFLTSGIPVLYVFNNKGDLVFEEKGFSEKTKKNFLEKLNKYGITTNNIKETPIKKLKK